MYGMSVCIRSEPGDFKNDRIWLKLYTLVPFIFQKLWFLGLGNEFLAKTRLKLWGEACRLHKCLDEYLWCFRFSKIFIFGAMVPLLAQNEANILGQPREAKNSKLNRFLWNLVHFPFVLYKTTLKLQGRRQKCSDLAENVHKDVLHYWD